MYGQWTYDVLCKNIIKTLTASATRLLRGVARATTMSRHRAVV